MKHQINTIRVACAALFSLAAVHPVLAQRMMTLEVQPPTANGTATMFVNDILGNAGNLKWTIPNINKNDTAAQKATKIVNAFNAANAGGKTDITLTQVAGTGKIVIKNPNKGGGLTGSFNPGTTGEKTDRMFIAPGALNSPTDIPGHMSLNNSSLGAGPSDYSLLDGQGNGAYFDAGVTLNGVDYLSDLSASQIDPNYLTDGGLVAGSVITQDLYNSLKTDLTGVSGVNLSESSDGLDVLLDVGPGAPGGDGQAGIIWGTTSTSVDGDGIGYAGQLDVVPAPEPGQMVGMAFLGLLGGGMGARRWLTVRRSTSV